MKISNIIAVLIPFLVLAFVFYGIQLDPGPLQAISYKSFMAMFACLCLWSVLRLTDLIGGINFRDWWKHASTVQHKTDYLRIRLIAYAVMFSFIVAFA